MDEDEKKLVLQAALKKVQTVVECKGVDSFCVTMFAKECRDVIIVEVSASEVQSAKSEIVERMQRLYDVFMKGTQGERPVVTATASSHGSDVGQGTPGGSEGG